MLVTSPRTMRPCFNDLRVIVRIGPSRRDGLFDLAYRSRIVRKDVPDALPDGVGPGNAGHFLCCPVPDEHKAVCIGDHDSVDDAGKDVSGDVLYARTGCIHTSLITQYI
jgi:hypothetical protein